MEKRRGGWRAATIVVLAFATLFYLQFGLQALAHHVLQGALSLLGAAALLWGTVRRVRRRPSASVLLTGTLPVLLLHAAMTIEDAAELPFLLGSIPVPLLAAVSLLRSSSRERSAERGSA